MAIESSWGECYFDHLSRFLGDPNARSVFRQTDGPAIQILTYNRVYEGCRVFCSLGLTHYERVLDGVGELFVPVDDGWDDVPDVLANALFYMIQHQMRLGWGVSVSGIENIRHEFAEAHGKSALYITNPYNVPDGFSTVECDGFSGKIYLGMFISQREHDFFVERGAKSFEDLLDSKQVDPFHIGRESSI